MFQIGCLFFIFTSLAFEDWAFEENKVLTSSSEYNLPILGVFLSEEGCCLSDKLQLEILQDPEFIKKTYQKMIL